MFDVFAFTATVKELDNNLTGELIRRVYQPFPHDLLLNFNRSASYGELLISCNPSMARFHLTKQKHKHPEFPPPFCMLLRNYLEGAKVQKLYHPPWERILEIHLSLGTNYYRLIAEVMGRHSNLILVDENNIIRGALKLITPDISTQRIIIPGRSYSPPPMQKKISPDEVDFNIFKEELSSSQLEDYSWKHRLISSFRGISPLQAEEITIRAQNEISRGNDSETIQKMWTAFEDIMEKYINGDFNPAIVEKNDGKTTYTVLDLMMFRKNKKQPFDSVHNLLDYYYKNKLEYEQKKQLKDSLNGILEKRLKKLGLKEQRQKEDLLNAKEAERYRLFGELLLAHLNQVTGKNTQIELTNLYDPGQKKIIIPLDPRYSAKDNAQKYFQKYRKLKKGEVKIKNLLSMTIIEKNYLESVLFSLDNADRSTLEQIRYELMQTGYIKKRATGKNKQKSPPKGKPLVFTSSSGFPIFVGQNNLQNEELTFNKVSRNDTWFHVQKLPGSHVIVKGSPFPPDEDTILEAATLAGYYSKARELPNVTIDYTQVKHVKRAPGNKPGMAIYKNFSSVIITPEGEALKRLINK